MATIASLVVDIFADTSKLVRGVEQTAGTLETLQRTASAVGSALAGAFSVRAIAGAASAATDAASQIQDAADRIGISAEAVQKLQFAAEQGGSSLDAVANSISRMAANLTDGDKSAVGALTTLGLGLDALRAMTPDAAFTAIADAIAKIPDPLQRASLAQDLFGKGAQTLLPAIVAGFTTVGDKAPLMSNAVVKAGDDMGDTWDKTQKKLDTLMASALIPIMELFMKMPAPLQTATAAVAGLAPVFESVGIAILAAGGPMVALGALKTALMSLSVLLTLPAGAIAAAIIGLVAVFMYWDEIVVIAQRVYNGVKEWMLDKFLMVRDAIGVAVQSIATFFVNITGSIIASAQGIYTGVKTWLVDKFTAVVDAIKKKVDAVSGFFKDMYDKVVGSSYVPDMIARIETEFGKLQSVMVDPTERAASTVSGTFAALGQDVAGRVSTLMGLIEHAMGPRMAAAMNTMKTAWDSGRQLMKGIGQLMMGDFSGVVNTIMSGIDLIKGAWNALQSLFGRDEEARSVNPARDRFVLQFAQAGESVAQAGGRLAALITQLTGEPGGGRWMRDLAAADTMAKFAAAVEAILALLREHGVGVGPIGTPTPAPGGGNGGGGGGEPSPGFEAAVARAVQAGMEGVVFELDGHRVSEAVAKRMPEVLALYGVR